MTYYPGGGLPKYRCKWLDADFLKGGSITISGEIDMDKTGMRRFIDALYTDEWMFNEDLWVKCYPHYLLTQEARE